MDEITEASGIIRSLTASKGFGFDKREVGIAILLRENANPPLKVARAAAQLMAVPWRWEDPDGNPQGLYRLIAEGYNQERKKRGWEHLPQLPLQ